MGSILCIVVDFPTLALYPPPPPPPLCSAWHQQIMVKVCGTWNGREAAEIALDRIGSGGAEVQVLPVNPGFVENSSVGSKEFKEAGGEEGYC
ncbi:hypothetical protein LOK49_LG08G01815 [Camellia lanceoleosa]|uniref:Uncharacterized protein n=1 Tax=Camellia lanceoleosa TaxID=1840588 RepID=A0ACC0GQY2_9ERIC|nr:hypothetical protein LOK49_LG08G01815 [Camellia lanceoleosa]